MLFERELRTKAGKEIKMGKRLRTAGELLLQFMKFGLFTFGGGWSIVAQMQQLYVEEKKTLTSEQLLDMTSVGRSLPGTMIGNVAMLYGYHAAGVLGGVACVVGMVLPPMAVLTLLTYCYTAIRDNPWVVAAMTGVRAAIVPIMASAALSLVKGAFRFPPCILVAVGCFALYLFWNVSCVWLVVLGALAGLAMGSYYDRRDQSHGAA